MQLFKNKSFELDMTTVIIPTGEMNNIMKIIKSLKGSSLLIKGVSKKIKNKAK